MPLVRSSQLSAQLPAAEIAHLSTRSYRSEVSSFSSFSSCSRRYNNLRNSHHSRSHHTGSTGSNRVLSVTSLFSPLDQYSNVENNAVRYVGNRTPAYGGAPPPPRRRLQRHSMYPDKIRRNSMTDFTARHKPPRLRPPSRYSLQWNCKYSTFQTYRMQVLGWTNQIGLGYLTKPDVISKFKKLGDAYWHSDDFWDSYHVSQPQVLYDLEYFYGMLLASQAKKPSPVLTKFQLQENNNGLLLWDSLVSRYHYGGSLSLYRQELWEKIDSPFAPSQSMTTEDIVDYVDSYELSVLKLESLPGGEPISDKPFAKKKLLSKLEEAFLWNPLLYVLIRSVSRDTATLNFGDSMDFLRREFMGVRNHEPFSVCK